MTSTAFMPFLPRAVEKVTTSPSRMLSINPVACTKISSLVVLSMMKPNPLDSLKNFTVPVDIGKKEKKCDVAICRRKGKCFSCKKLNFNCFNKNFIESNSFGTPKFA